MRPGRAGRGRSSGSHLRDESPPGEGLPLLRVLAEPVDDDGQRHRVGHQPDVAADHLDVLGGGWGADLVDGAAAPGHDAVGLRPHRGQRGPGQVPAAGRRWCGPAARCRACVATARTSRWRGCVHPRRATASRGRSPDAPGRRGCGPANERAVRRSSSRPRSPAARSARRGARAGGGGRRRSARSDPRCCPDASRADGTRAGTGVRGGDRSAGRWRRSRGARARVARHRPGDRARPWPRCRGPGTRRTRRARGAAPARSGRGSGSGDGAHLTRRRVAR